MAVDRTARAWVLYSSGEIFWVNTVDGSCKPSGFARRQNGFETFGMGFVSNAEGSENETLFLAGGPYDNQRVANLASVDPKPRIDGRDSIGLGVCTLGRALLHLHHSGGGRRRSLDGVRV
jgi:hypothetical protein